MSTPAASFASWTVTLLALALLGGCVHKHPRLPSKYAGLPGVTVVPTLAESERYPTAFRYCSDQGCSRVTRKTAVTKSAEPPPRLANPPSSPVASLRTAASSGPLAGEDEPVEPNWRVFRTKLGASSVLNAPHRLQLKIWHRSIRRDVEVSRYEIAALGPDRAAQLRALTRGLRALGVSTSMIFVAAHRPLPFGINAEVRIVEWRPLDPMTSVGRPPASDATPAPAQAGRTSTTAPSASISIGASQ